MEQKPLGEKTASDFLDEIGREALAERLGVTLAALRVAPKQGGGKLPASWFVECQRLASDVGAKCEAGLFNFKTASSQDTAA